MSGRAKYVVRSSEVETCFSTSLEVTEVLLEVTETQQEVTEPFEDNRIKKI